MPTIGSRSACDSLTSFLEIRVAEFETPDDYEIGINEPRRFRFNN